MDPQNGHLLSSAWFTTYSPQAELGAEPGPGGRLIGRGIEDRGRLQVPVGHVPGEWLPLLPGDVPVSGVKGLEPLQAVYLGEIVGKGI